jgi:RimJ/RimL family protein N-acetyltransferase
VRLRTERLLLRPFAPGDFDAMLAMQSDAGVVRYLYWDARTEDEVRVVLERKGRFTTLERPGDNLAFAVVLEVTGEVVGDCGLQWHDNDYRQGEVGFIVHPDHQGRGYATEAARAVLRIGFEEVRLHRIVGRTEARNVASARVLERLGMRREAHLIENEYVKGEWQSELVYALLDREWAAALGAAGAAARTTAPPG